MKKQEYPKDDVLTIEHLEAVRDLWTGLHPAFDIELFKANNPHIDLSKYNLNYTQLDMPRCRRKKPLDSMRLGYKMPVPVLVHGDKTELHVGFILS